MAIYTVRGFLPGEDPMPLLDHFHPPLSTERHWEAFHGRWAAAIADQLNADLLPAGYFAEAQVRAGGRVEVDVAAYDAVSMHAAAARPSLPGAGGGGNVATAEPEAWSPPTPAISIPTAFPGSFAVHVFSREGGPTLVAAVELVSPRNKDRPDARRAFAGKCVAYRHDGVGLVVVDVVTSRPADLHHDVVNLLAADPAPPLATAGDALYAVAYRPVRTEAGDRIDAWPFPLAVGAPLPTVPLALGRGGIVPLNVEAAYDDVRRRSRLG